MSDRLHTHLEHGVVAGCPGCEQTRVDLARSRTCTIRPGCAENGCPFRFAICYNSAVPARQPELARA